ncbi:unnamed protein product [Effrenium voratum]|uniref:Beta-catenin-like protein 1 N-terminal domain-containing protein n=1 Tax=Effrenium voratum TaxID=2562239 RepID=A0AA36HU96_9DINO|nr:unnamed protein product [Effrenium voratum]
MESNFEKMERLLEMHEEYHQSVKEADSARDKGLAQQIDRELEVNEEEQLYLDRCDAGLFTLQQVDLILVRLVNMGNRQASEEIGKLMDVKGVKLAEVRDIVLEYCRTNLGPLAREERKEVMAYLQAMLTRYGGDASLVEEEAAAATGAATPEEADGAVTPEEADPNQVTDDEAEPKTEKAQEPEPVEKEEQKKDKKEKKDRKK